MKSHTLKQLLQIILDRISNKIRLDISEVQFGFVAERGTTNAIYTMTMLIERSIDVKRDLHLCFIEYSWAFDKVRHREFFTLSNRRRGLALNVSKTEIMTIKKETGPPMQSTKRCKTDQTSK